MTMTSKIIIGNRNIEEVTIFNLLEKIGLFVRKVTFSIFNFYFTKKC